VTSVVPVPLARLGTASELTLLLIEDSRSDSDLVRALLETELPHATIDVAVDLHDALAQLDSKAFDLVLADLSLPDADGLAVVHAVRAAHHETALLVLTGRVDGDLALWALAEGAQDYLVKGQHDGPRLAVAVLHALQRQRAELEAHRYLQLARGLLDAIEAPTCAVAADGKIVAVNQAWQVFTQADIPVGEAWQVGGNYLAACLAEENQGTALSAASGEHAFGLRAVLARDVERHQSEYARTNADEERWFSVRMSPVEIEDQRGAVISHVDVTEMHRVHERLSHQSLHDDLTGLPNRVLLTDRLTQALADAQRRGLEVGLAFLDLDNFKRINDSLGHAAGDALLSDVAERLTTEMRAGDTLSHYSGDEFVVIWRDLSSADEAGNLSERLARAFAEPFTLGTTQVTISASIGVIVGRPRDTADDLLMAADAAMYDAKRHGGGRVRVFTDELRDDSEQRAALEVSLRKAVGTGGLELHYQPVIALATGRAVAVEALARWTHPERGRIGPDQFIPVAEASGLIVDLGRWALEQACRDAVAFTGAAKGLDVAVNLSVRQLIHPDVVAQVHDALVMTGLDPRRLVLEVTESAVMDEGDAAAVALDGLTALGVRIAIDDFGTGYSSLLYLRRYPISALKLDRAFVSGLGRNDYDDAICSSVVSLAHAVDATSIAEGVETVEQYRALLGLGCQLAQGFLWSPAVPVDRLSAALTRASEVRVPSPQDGAYDVDALADQVRHLQSSGASVHTIAAALNQSGAGSPTGMRWSGVAVRALLADISAHKNIVPTARSSQ
jgi:diguanylate cyclase (GGDEF)-like protein